MRRVVLRGMLGRKLRTGLTAFAVVLGVAMVSGAYILTDTLLNAANGRFTSTTCKISKFTPYAILNTRETP